tara:strand:- start:366 stop:1046 length:681 start_codon:yes stop_codon:yes gene_type:complete
MNYLNLVNNVLRRLRESEVTTVENRNDGDDVTGATDYGKLIGLFVNDAKRMVEDSWDWSNLRETKTVTTEQTTYSYAISGLGTAFKLLDAVNDTSNSWLKQQGSSWMTAKFLLSDAPEGDPSHFSWNGFDASGNAIVDVYPKPDGVYSLKFNVVNRSGTFQDDTGHVLGVPSAPVIAYAVALASRERGETGGMTAQELYAIADACLADAIAMDAARFPTETIWYTV